MVALKRAWLLNQQSRCSLRASAQNDDRELRRTIDSAGRDFHLLSGKFRGVLIAFINKERKMTNEANSSDNTGISIPSSTNTLDDHTSHFSTSFPLSPFQLFSLFRATINRFFFIGALSTSVETEEN